MIKKELECGMCYNLDYKKNEYEPLSEWAIFPKELKDFHNKINKRSIIFYKKAFNKEYNWCIDCILFMPTKMSVFKHSDGTAERYIMGICPYKPFFNILDIGCDKFIKKLLRWVFNRA